MNDYFRTTNTETGAAVKQQLEKGFAALVKSNTSMMASEDMADIEEQIRRDNAEVPYHANEFDHQYKDNLRYIRDMGERRTDRTGVTTVSVFGDVSHKIDLRKGFPGTTLKRLAFQANKVETIDWMLQGKFDLKTLKDRGVRIWDQNVKPGTEVYEGAPLSVEQRLAFLAPHQLKTFNELRDELFESEEVDDSEFHISMGNRLNNWGIPERALSDGDLGPIYGKQWRAWEDTRVIDIDTWHSVEKRKYEAMGFLLYHIVRDRFGDSTHFVIKRKIDQVADVKKAIAAHSDSRRIILTGWNVAQLDEMSLPPCHTMAQWYVSQKKDENGLPFLDCKMYQRSADFLLGVPFNVAQYAMLTEMLANVHGLRARFLHHTVGDAHIYLNHLEQGHVDEIINRPVIHKSPKLKIEDCPIPRTSILDIRTVDISMVGYESYEAQKNVPIAK